MGVARETLDARVLYFLVCMGHYSININHFYLSLSNNVLFVLVLPVFVLYILAMFKKTVTLMLFYFTALVIPIVDSYDKLYML